jgi:hypothetical protein
MASEHSTSQGAADAAPAREAEVGARSAEQAPVRNADWSIPAWVRHPRLEAVLNARLADLTWRHLNDLIERRVAEDLSVDFKGSHYLLDRAIARAARPDADLKESKNWIAKDRFEFAKDVTAFANTAGGLIVIGISEVNGRANGFSPVTLKDQQRQIYFDTVMSWTTPYLSGIQIGHVSSPHDAEQGCVLIYVPPSGGRPHAVAEPNSYRYTWHVRNGNRTSSLSEAEVAVRYRDRYADRISIEQRVQTVFQAGVLELARGERAWLCVAVAPSQSAERRHLDRGLLEEFKMQTTKRQESLPGPQLGYQPSFGRGRIVLRDSSPSGPFATDHLIHMYVDGCAFAAIGLQNLEDTASLLRGRPDLPWDVQCIRIGDIASWVLTLAGITCGHAVDAGASGELELLCGIVTATQEDADILAADVPLAPLEHVIVEQPLGISLAEDLIPGTHPRTKLSPAATTISVSVVTELRDLITLGAQLVNEIVAEFGHLPSDSLLTLEGFVVGENCRGDRLGPLRSWASAFGTLLEDQSATAPQQ